MLRRPDIASERGAVVWRDEKREDIMSLKRVADRIDQTIARPTWFVTGEFVRLDHNEAAQANRFSQSRPCATGREV